MTSTFIHVSYKLSIFNAYPPAPAPAWARLSTVVCLTPQSLHLSLRHRSRRVTLLAHTDLGLRNTTRYAASNRGVGGAALVELSQRGRLSACFHRGREHLLRVTLLLRAQLPHGCRSASGFALVRRPFKHGNGGKCARCGTDSRLTRSGEDAVATAARRVPLFLRRVPRSHPAFDRQDRSALQPYHGYDAESPDTFVLSTDGSPTVDPRRVLASTGPPSATDLLTIDDCS